MFSLADIEASPTQKAEGLGANCFSPSFSLSMRFLFVRAAEEPFSNGVVQFPLCLLCKIELSLRLMWHHFKVCLKPA